MPRVPFDPATDYYGLLGVPSSAPVEAIQAAYRRLAKAYHPDLNAGSEVAEARMARLNVAKTVLLDPLTRAAYDQQRRVRRTRPVVTQRVVHATARVARPVAQSVPPSNWAATHTVRPDYGQ